MTKHKIKEIIFLIFLISLMVLFNETSKRDNKKTNINSVVVKPIKVNK